MTCVTWGLAASLADPRNDADIARQTRTRYGMPHEYFHRDFTDEPVRDVFARFLLAGEGRIEDFSGYTDGFKAWSVSTPPAWPTILRGDCPGWGSPYDPIDEMVARSLSMHSTLVSDYPEGHLIHRLGLVAAAPAGRPLSARGRDPAAVSRPPLQRLRAAHVHGRVQRREVRLPRGREPPARPRRRARDDASCPTSSATCASASSAWPAHSSPSVPFADNPADEQPGVYLSRPDVRGEIMEELSSAAARRVFSEEALRRSSSDLARPLSSDEDASSRPRQGPRAAPGWCAPSARRRDPSTRTPRLAFRAYIASRMHTILREDAEALGQRDGLSRPACPRSSPRTTGLDGHRAPGARRHRPPRSR